MNKRYCAYYRVSTDRQGVSGLGLEAQKEAVENYLTSNGGTLEIDFIEIESGKNNKRAELTKAIEHCRKHKTTLLIAKLDRLSRNVHFITGLMESNIDFVAVDQPQANKLMIQMLACFAEHEREMISARTTAALQAAKVRGVELGIYGKTLAKQNKDKANQFALKLLPVVQEIKAQGVKTIRGICEELNNRDIRTSRNNPFYPTTTYQLLKRLERLKA